ncbi:glycoprotein endo-alpha-1,2-mannosidase [Aplysia californica]|uniref:Glycoprotein endo-alpha-1,2-mannosidase n=1 Tax=Aplysia californica TaxID=6500 RepID=A0ABM0JMI3_APLCA|nr:glycoprotein endo-alpha-1,2-mannosidase [Aplysia californica]XP_005097168.1 glycoprotein endo-alpha-1,2-mannosidase [Aplysia californica]XP_005097169.1 glycoprotein endo-alpha-1,2-mannosidase [Aplysia californica]
MAFRGYFRASKKYCLAVLVVASLISFIAFTFMTSTRAAVSKDQLTDDHEALKKIVFASKKHLPLKDANSVYNVPPKNADSTKDFSSFGKDDQISDKEVQVAKEEPGLSEEGQVTNFSRKSRPFVDFAVHIFYYPWYKNPQTDGKYAHWNHELIPHWSDKTHTRKRQYQPPADIGANFYPQLGPYSSADPQVIKMHMKQISDAGVGVLSVSWYPPQHEKSSETPVDSLMPSLLDAAADYGLKIAFHIEPYSDRSGETLKEVLTYIIVKYGNHPAFYRTQHKGKQLPLIYLYDSYQIDSKLWADALKADGRFTIRGTEYDAVVIGLLVEHNHMKHLVQSGFDGFYTYFASNGFSYGCTWHNWPLLAKEAKDHNLIFIPSIGPGYIDTRVRTWNGKNTKLRLHGKYYTSAFKSALAVKPPFLSITSFNEWHEGTQVEAAIPKTGNDGYKYEDYRPGNPQFYMNLTKQIVHEYYQNRTAVHVIKHNHDDVF